MILVTGATGNFGAAAIKHLLRKGVDPSQVAALVRDESKAADLRSQGIELRTGDYADYDSLVRAFKGVDRLLLVSSSDRGPVENRTAHHIAAIRAAKEAGVQHIVYTSFVRKPGYQTTTIAAFQASHAATEEFLKGSGVAYTILQNGIYAEMIPVFAGGKVAETGVILYPAGEGRATWVLRDELAEAAAHVITSEGHEGKTYPLTNTASVSFSEIATALSAVLGREVVYQSPPTAEFTAIMGDAGVPPVYIDLFAMWAGAQATGALDLEDGTLTTFLGRKPTTVADFLSLVYGGK